MIGRSGKIKFSSHTCLAYLSKFNDEVTSLLISLAEGALKNSESFGRSSNKVSFLIAESFQNIIRHGAAEEELKEGLEEFKDYFQIDIYDDKVLLSSANVIQQNLVESLINRINQLNSFSKQELKELKRKVLEEGKLSAKGGANLGLIEIIRKSGTPLKSHLIKLNEQFSQVFLSTEMITNEGKPYEEEITISDVVEQYQFFSQEGVIFYYSGDFSLHSNLPIIEMLHRNIMDGDKSKSNSAEIIITIIEIIQNVSKHGHTINNRKPGMIALIDTSEGRLFSCSNYVAPSAVAALELNLQKIKASSPKKLDSLYQERLAEARQSKAGKRGLGLLEMAKIARNNFRYQIEKSTEGNYVFTIEIIMNQ